MKVYIAGPMTGLPEHNYPAFNAAAAAWREAGWEVENPAEHFGGLQDVPYTECVVADVEVIKSCDAMAMLPDWDAGHSGAIWERAIALQILHIPVYDATRPPRPLPSSIGKFIDQVVPAKKRCPDWDTRENSYGKR